VNNPCQLCQKRRARRHCPGIRGDICPNCCGTERENTIDCPLNCEHLQEARRREKLPELNPADVPNQDVRIKEGFLQEQQTLIVWLVTALAKAMEKERAVDGDAREALDALIKTYRTLESGLIYETKPANPYAAALQQALQQSIEELRKQIQQETGMHRLRDADILGALIVLQRLELQHANGRRRGRAFLDFLLHAFPAPAPATAASSVLV
jgi:hypothetical protein